MAPEAGGHRALRRGWERLSLRTRLLAILLGALLALQLLTVLAVGWSRGLDARHLADDLVTADVQRVQAQLAALPAAERASALAPLDRAGYRWRLVPARAPLPSAEAPRLVELARRFAPPSHPVRWQGELALRLPLDATHDLVVAFPDGLPSTTPAPGVAAAYLLVVTLAVAGVAWLAVSVATRPLARAAAAAHAMSADLRGAPMPESGPPELGELARALNAMQHEVHRQLDARTRMLAAVTHDLKTPITRLKLRLAELPDADLRARLEADLDAMQGLVEEGLAYARSERLHEERHAVDLDALVENIVDQAVDTGHDCRFTPAALGTVNAAPRALARLLQNLVDNAVRYGGHAEISVRRAGGEVQLDVADRGPGVPEADLERLFEPFVRGETSRGRDTGGTGLGLAIARNIALSHGGRLWLENRPGGGLVARLRLPAG